MKGYKIQQGEYEMKKVWILLANAEKATIYTASERDYHFSLVQKLSHSESRLKSSDLVSDKPGHYQKNESDIRGSFNLAVDHKILEITRFAKEICKVLESGRTSNAYESIIIIAEPRFYGLINKNATKHVRNLIKYHYPKDYTHYSEHKLKEELQSILAHEMRLLLIS